MFLFDLYNSLKRLDDSWWSNLGVEIPGTAVLALGEGLGEWVCRVMSAAHSK